MFAQEYFLGTVLSGSVAGKMPTTVPSDSLAVHVTFLALEKVPATPYTPVGSRAVFFSSTNGGSAVLPAAELTRGATIADLKDPSDFPVTLRAGNAGRITRMTTLTGALPPGVTAQFLALDPEPVHNPLTGESTRRSVQVLVTRITDPTSPRQIALVLRDLVPRREGRFGLQTETALFDLPAGDRTNTALVVPFHFDDAISRATAILVQIGPGTTDASHIAAIRSCIAQLKKLSAASQPAITTGEANQWATVIAAVQSLAPQKGRRETLAFLADQTGASICEDVAMEADDATLAQLVKNIQATVATSALPQDDPTVGWLLDHAALELLAKLADDSANGTKVPAELLAILATHTGEVGRHPSSVDEVLKGLSSRAELDNRLLAENTIFLEDSSPASRVRAYDWLNARHLAPAGYDPLASGRARRDALEKAAGSQ